MVPFHFESNISHSSIKMNVIKLWIFFTLTNIFVGGIRTDKNVYDRLYNFKRGGNYLFISTSRVRRSSDIGKILYAFSNSSERIILKDKKDVLNLSKNNKFSFTKSKQIATIGPASENFDDLESLLLNGIDVFRLNFSHGPKSIKKYVINSIRILEKKYDTPISILGDIQGPKIRIGEFEKTKKNDEKEQNTFVELQEGDIFQFDISDELGNKNRVQLKYPEILKNIKEGHVILLDDGNLKMKVIKNNSVENINNLSITTQVITGGKLYSKKGFSVPNMIMPIDLLNEKDIKDILFCINEGVDFLGYSFVQTEYDLKFLKTIIHDYYTSDFFKNKKKDRLIYDLNKLEKKDYDDEQDFYIKEVNDYYQNYYLKKLKQYKQIYDIYKNKNLSILTNVGDPVEEMQETVTEETTNKKNENQKEKEKEKEKTINDHTNIDPNNTTDRIFIISKIEKPSAIKNIDNIIKESDGIMIARGDLGIETNLSTLPILQKKLINLCRIKYNKPVIVATQMLESMRFLPLPTRAEISDVATALYDGADCVMLSAETATGQYPALTVATQNNIIKNVENDYYYYDYVQRKNDTVKNHNKRNNFFHEEHGLDTCINQKKDSFETSYFEKLIYSIRDISNNVNLKSIILFSNEFYKIIKLSNLRTKAPIIVITENIHLARKLQLMWGIYPFVAKQKNLFQKDVLDLINYGCNVSKEEGFIKDINEYSLVTFTKNINSANLLYLCQPMLLK